MSDDSEPPSRNPFVRFKQHIDSRINTGFSIVTGGPKRPETSMMNASPNPVLPHSDSYMRNRKFVKLDDAARRYWVDWAESSPYSPFNLSHLQQPLPAGITPGDYHLFGFEDAFEDLMAASQGKPMMNLDMEADFRRGLYKLHPYGETPQSWVSRLERRGLLLSPRSTPSAIGRDTESTIRESEILQGVAAQQERLRAIQSQRQAKTAGLTFPSNHEELTQQMLAAREELMKALDQDVTFNPAKMIREFEERFASLGGLENLAKEAEKIAKRFEKDMEKFGAPMTPKEAVQAAHQLAKNLEQFDLDKFLSSLDIPKAEPSKTTPPDQPKPQPDTEEDFFSAIFGALMDTSTTRPTEAAQEKGRQPQQQSNQLFDGERKTVEDNEWGGKTIRLTSVFANPRGGRTERSEVQVLDHEGNVISHETKVSHAGSSDAAKDYVSGSKLLEQHNQKMQAAWAQARGEEEKAMGKASEGSEGEKSTGGWFWR